MGQFWGGQRVVAQTVDAAQLVQQGIERYQLGDYKSAIAPWEAALKIYREAKNQASAVIVLENLARAYQRLGRNQQALPYWKQVVEAYRQLENLPQVGRSLIEQAQVHSYLGQPKQAIEYLCQPKVDGTCTEGSALQIARMTQDTAAAVAALGSLGDAYRLVGDYQQALTVLQAGLELTQKLDDPRYHAAVLNSLGNTHGSLAQLSYRRAYSAELRGDSRDADLAQQIGVSEDDKAQNYFLEGLRLVRAQNDVQGQLRTILSLVPLYYRIGTAEAADQYLQEGQNLLKQLPESREKVYAMIDLARLQQPGTIGKGLLRTDCLQPRFDAAAEQLIKQSITVAQRLQDPQAESYALGELGHIYECRGNYSQALDLTQKARWIAEPDRVADSLYLWEWQTGRILKAQGRTTEAIAAYGKAIATLETVRNEILAANRDLQFDFRDTIEPVYRELVNLKLSQSIKEDAIELTQKLSAALNIMDSLKLKELQNYFGSNCVLPVTPKEETQSLLADKATAVFSSIVLEDRTAIVASLPNNQKKLAWISTKSDDLRREVNEFRRGLERFYDAYDPQQAQKLYDWIIRPFASDLEKAQIKTLIFVQDDILRSIPMSALHDGEKFLVQRYAIATTPSLALTIPKLPERRNLRALALGVTQSVTIDGQQFPALRNVGQEIDQIEIQMPGSKQLLNAEFTQDRLKKELSKRTYPIIHIATHGKFGTEPEETFIVTGNQQKLTLNELDSTIRSIEQGRPQIDLIALMACETAVGDERAALGFAGIAVRAGVSSALASLWFVNDMATAKIAAAFYAVLAKEKVGKAEALQIAQKALIESGGIYAHPAYWAPFVLVGNWL
jgi:CHAT domain-containing protein